MSGLVLVLRPEPGAGETAARARRLGLEPVTVPLFTVRPLPWDEPDGIDAVLLTSANAARLGGPKLAGLVDLACYAVGEATAAAAAAAGFTDIRTGTGDGSALLGAIGPERRVLHLCGRDHIALEHPAVRIERRIVYAADAADALPPAAEEALRRGAVALIHSPRAGALFAALAAAAGLEPSDIALAAISPAAASAAGRGWRSVAVAVRPRDDALLEVAAKLCQKAPEAE